MIKPIKALLCVVLLHGFLVTVCCSAPEFSGVLKSSGTIYLALRPEAKAAIGWYRVGESFGDYQIVSYDDARDTVVLSQAGARIELRLNGARVESAPTISLVEKLARGGDEALQKQLPDARKLEDRRAETAAEIKALEARVTSDPAAAERIPDLRRKLKIEEDNLNYYLEQLVKSRAAQAKP